MRLIFFVFIFIKAILCNLALASDEVIFNIDNQHKASMRISNRHVSYHIDDGNVNHAKEISVDTVKKINLIVGDFNFDGKKDFSIVHIDDGMGVYYIYRFFLFSVKLNDFIEIYPSCGDEFINIRIDKKKKVIMSTYYQDNQPMLCITKPPKI
ncbi:XAC2610-related protein [Serratia aquatilis]|uniref:XAC2610-related protein n=1 Tax=Serratia aquatilis TaxID=1737515 RepID=A0ABV6EIT2_9GAMM